VKADSFKSQIGRMRKSDVGSVAGMALIDVERMNTTWCRRPESCEGALPPLISSASSDVMFRTRPKGRQTSVVSSSLSRNEIRLTETTVCVRFLFFTLWSLLDDDDDHDRESEPRPSRSPRGPSSRSTTPVSPSTSTRTSASSTRSPSPPRSA
jgi:hypothetical protein